MPYMPVIVAGQLDWHQSISMAKLIFTNAVVSTDFKF